VKIALLRRAALDLRRSTRSAILAGLSPSVETAKANEAARKLLSGWERIYVSGLHRADCEIGATFALRAPEFAVDREEWLGASLGGLHPLAVLSDAMSLSDLGAVLEIIGKIETAIERIGAMIGIARRLFEYDSEQAIALLHDAVSLAAQMQPPGEEASLDGAIRDDAYVALLEAALLLESPLARELLAQIVEPAQRCVAHSALAAHHAACGDLHSSALQLTLLESEWVRLGEGDATSWLVYQCTRKIIGLPPDIAIPVSIQWLGRARDAILAAGDPASLRSWCLALGEWQASPAELAGVLRAVVGSLQENRAGDLPELLECLSDARQHATDWPSEADQDIARLLLSVAPDQGLRWLPFLKPGDERVNALRFVAGECDEVTWKELRGSVLAQRDYLFEDSQWFEALLAVARAGIGGTTDDALDLLRTALMTAYARPEHRMVDMCWIAGSIVWRFADHLAPDAAATLASDHYRITEPFR
jgi:hypothetical protein